MAVLAFSNPVRTSRRDRNNTENELKKPRSCLCPRACLQKTTANFLKEWMEVAEISSRYVTVETIFGTSEGYMFLTKEWFSREKEHLRCNNKPKKNKNG